MYVISTVGSNVIVLSHYLVFAGLRLFIWDVGGAHRHALATTQGIATIGDGPD